MRRVLLVLLLVALSAQGTESLQTEKSETDKMMEYYLEQAKPVAEHQRLTELAGRWKVTMKFWFGPDAEPQTASGTGIGKLILGGRFLQIEMEVKGSFNEQSLSMFGFDRRTNEYTLVGFDTMGTYYITAAGKYAAAEKAVVLHGSYKQPPTGEEQQYRFHWTNPSPREHLLTLYFSMGGKDVRVAETRFVRE